MNVRAWTAAEMMSDAAQGARCGRFVRGYCVVEPEITPQSPRVAPAWDRIPPGIAGRSEVRSRRARGRRPLGAGIEIAAGGAPCPTESR